MNLRDKYLGEEKYKLCALADATRILLYLGHWFEVRPSALTW